MVLLQKMSSKRKFSGVQGGIAKRRAKSKTAALAMRGLARARGAVRRQHLITDVKGLDTRIDLNPVIATTNTNASSFVLNLVRSGTGYYQRVGSKIAMKSLRLRFSVHSVATPAATTADVQANYLRMVVVYDNSPNSGSIPTFDTIFGSTLQDGTEASGQLDTLRYDNTSRFTVLRDRVIDVNPAAITTAGTTNIMTSLTHVDDFIPLKGLMAHFSGDSTPMTIADIQSGALYVFFRSNFQSGVTYNYIADSQVRLRYFDK